MSELAERIQRLQSKQKAKQVTEQREKQNHDEVARKAKEQAREDNRRSMPETAEIFDTFESVFGKGQVKILHAEENGKVLNAKGYIHDD